MRFSRILVVLTILSGLSLLVHRYLWLRLVRDAAWPKPWGVILTVLLFTLAALIPLVFITMRSAPRSWGGPLAWVGYTWMGFMFYLLVFSALGDAGLGTVSAFGLMPADPAQRRFVARALALGIGVLSGGVGLTGLWNVTRGFRVRRVRVPLAKWPQAASGYVIAQISDVHVGPTLGRGFVEDVVRETNALNPDLIAITGDLVDGTVEQLRDQVEPLRGLKARDGVYFVTGNHEYYSGADDWVAYLQTLGIRVLRNEHVQIRDVFELAGVDDYSAARMLPHHGQDVAKALSGRNPDHALVLLAHQPKSFKEAGPAGVDLQLSGHVHGGQMVPFNWVTYFEQPFVAGLYRENQSWIYVSEGTGYWGPPMRVGTRSEITRLELVRAREAEA